MTIPKRIEIADDLKAIGNAQFKEKKWLKAGEKYTKALRYLEKFEKESPKKEKEEGTAINVVIFDVIHLFQHFPIASLKKKREAVVKRVQAVARQINKSQPKLNLTKIKKK